jgi:hypothetical protein
MYQYDKDLDCHPAGDFRGSILFSPQDTDMPVMQNKKD